VCVCVCVCVCINQYTYIFMCVCGVGALWPDAGWEFCIYGILYIYMYREFYIYTGNSIVIWYVCIGSECYVYDIYIRLWCDSGVVPSENSQTLRLLSLCE
jgi:hypothetical protein